MMSNENENDQGRKEGSSTLNTHERTLGEQLEAKENSDSPSEAVGEPLNPFENGHPILTANVSATVEESGNSPVDSLLPPSVNVDVSESPQGLVEPNFGSIEAADPPDLKVVDPANEKLDIVDDQNNSLEPMGGSVEAAAPLDIEDEATVDKTVDTSHNFADFVEPIKEKVEGSVEPTSGIVEGSAGVVHERIETCVAHMHESFEDSVEPARETIEATVSVDRKDEATADQNGGTIEMPLKEDEIADGNLAVNQEPFCLEKVDNYVINESELGNAEDNRPVVKVEDVSYMISYDDELENNMAGSMNIDAEQVDAPTAENGSSSMKKLFLFDENDEGNVSGTEQEQSLFTKELENFFKERKMEFRPPKFYGEGLNCLKLWRAVIGLGGYDRVTSSKLWRQVGESFRPPKTCTTVSWTFRGFYEKALLDFEKEKTLSGELNIQAPLSAEPMCIDNQASGSGRTPRESATRARQGWHSQRILGNGEVSDPIVKSQEKSAFSAQKREKQLKCVGPLKRKKQPLEEDAVTTPPPKAAKTQVDVSVVDIGTPADWVKINVQKTMDCFEVYALVPGLLREEVRVQSDPAGRLVISGDPEQPDNPWGVTPFKKIINLPSRIDPHQTSAVVTLHGQLFVAVYAEFRRDWSEAFRFYDESYRIVREMIGSSTRLPPIQQLVEIKSVAEQLHFKMSTLLLHSGKTLEAVTSFRQHKASYKRLVGSAEAIHLHWEWMSRQFLVFAELLETSSTTNQSVSPLLLDAADMTLTEWEFRPAYYYQLAALYLKRKRSVLEIASSMWEESAEIDSPSKSVVPSAYVGQFARLLEQGDLLSMQSLTDEDYIRYSLAEGKRFQHSNEIIALLKRCYELYGSLKVQRMGATCGLEIAKEYFSVGNFGDAKQLFDSLANLHRQEGWVTLLWEVLGYLREGSRKLATVKDFVEYSLEMAALPVYSDGKGPSLVIKESSPAGPPSLQQRESIHKEVLELVMGDSATTPEETSPVKVTEDNPLHLEIDHVSPLRSVLLAAVAFHEQTVKPGASTSITVSLLSQLPLQVEIDQLDIQFNQSECNFTIVKADQFQSAGNHVGLQNRRVETSPSLSLSTNKWLRLAYDIRSEQSGKLECISIFAKLASHFTIFCRAESPASMDDLPLWKFEDRTEPFPTKDPALAITGQKALQVEEAEPLVDLNLDASGPALVGERFIVPVTMVARGHDIYAGELKINLVDVRDSGLFSPREAESSSLDNCHVELLGVTGAEGGEETGTVSDTISTIQQSFWLISVPEIRNGDSWSCKLEIRWHRPKATTLFVSLGYYPHGNELSGQRIHVHKSLQIEGKNALTISHRFLLPIRRDPLILSGIKRTNELEQLPSLALNEKNVLVVSTINCTEVPLLLESFSIKVDDENAATSSCSIKPGSEDLKGPTQLAPGKEYKKVFTVCPQEHTPVLSLGSLLLKWRRDSGTADNSVFTEHKLPDIRVELPPLTVSLKSPPYAILGDPFTYHVKVTNQTHLLQEVKFSLSDSQSFVMAGPHSSSVSVLPKVDHILSYKLVPLASGSLKLPKVTLTSVRYSAVFQSSADASSIFAYPSKPSFKIVNEGDQNKAETIEAT